MAAFGGWRLTRAGILFVIGIIVLGGLVTGGIFLVKNHGEAVRHDQAVKIAEQNLKDQSKVATQPASTDSGKGSNSSNGAGSANNSTNSTGAQSNTGTSTATSTTSTSSNAAQLPETGFDASSVLGRTLIVAILALSVAFYVSSRRAARAL